MNPATLLYRQINPAWIQLGRVTSQAFKPTPKDQKRLSVYDGDQLTAAAAWEHYTAELGFSSVGVLGVTVAECAAARRAGPRAFSGPRRDPLRRLHHIGNRNPRQTASKPRPDARLAASGRGRMIAGLKPYPRMKDSGVPLLEDGGIEAFLRREVLPHALDAWYLPDSVKTGYEFSFTRYFYQPKPLRALEEIRADILALERETEGLLGEIVGGIKS